MLLISGYVMDFMDFETTMIVKTIKKRKKKNTIRKTRFHSLKKPSSHLNESLIISIMIVRLGREIVLIPLNRSPK